MFVLKRNLEKLKMTNESKHDNQNSSNYETKRTRSPRQNSSASNSGVLPKICIFCEKQSKYLKRSNTREKLYCCAEIRADESIRKAATTKDDSNEISICADELIAKEAVYHKSCYRDYTRCNHNFVKQGNLHDPSTECLYGAYEVVNEMLFELIDNPRIIQYIKLTETLETELRKLENIEEKILEAAKKNLKPRIENNFNCFDFTTFERKLYIYPTIFKENVIEEYLSLKNDLNLFVTNAAMSVRNEIRNTSDTMP